MICKTFPISDRLLVAIAHIDEPIPREFHAYAKPNQADPNARQIQKWKSRRMAFFLLRQLFKKIGLNPDLLNAIKKTASGRPYIEHPNIDFNITHSGDYVAVMVYFSENKKVVGIDLEHPQKIRRFKQLLAYYANSEELDFIQTKTDLTDDFYLSWCLREAVLKSQGVGIIKLSEVKHFPEQKNIQTDYCPKGILHFIKREPFYLCYFFEQAEISISPDLFQWQHSHLQKITDIDPLVYHVNF